MPENSRNPRKLAAAAAVAIAASGLTVLSGVIAAPTASAAGGSGASVPFVEYEAESASTNGSTIGPDYTQASLPSEASGRKAVTLNPGQYVEFTLSAAANAIDVRYSVADGRSGKLGVYVGSQKAGELELTSKYSYIDTSWIPGAKNHKFYDETRMLLGQNVAAGGKVKVQVDDSVAGAVTVDLADFEQVGGPDGAPANSISVTDSGATPNDGSDDTQAFRTAVDAAKSQGKVLYVPQGTFELGQSLQVDNVTIQGAGQWYTVLHSNNPFQNGGAQGNIHLKNFAVMGEVTERNDGSPDNAFHGVLGANSSVTGLWIQHMKCGLWLMNGASSHLTISDNRILDTTADGINFDGNVTDSVITNNFLRSNGDDGLALWSNGAPDARDTISNNTVVQPQLANGIAVYGGTDQTVTGNLVRDTNALGGGILVANRFNATPLSGTITVSHNTTIRAGALDPNWQFGVGAFWVDARDSSPNAAIRVTDFRAVASPYEAFQFIDGNGAGKSITNVSVDGASVEGVGTFVAQAQTGGSVSLSNITASGVGVVGTYNCPYPSTNQPMSFSGSGNSGWDGTWADCSSWPAPGSGPGNPPVDGNLALHRSATASGQAEVYAPANAVDGNANSYWESANNAFPQWLTVDLGAVQSVSRVVLKLPPSSAWGARTQTLSVLGSSDGGSYGTLSGSHGYSFDPASGNTATVTFAAASVRYVRVQITANTGWPAGQLSELEVYGS